MVSAQETFRTTVIEPLKVNRGTQALSYADYLRLPAAQRSNDEADVVDSRFTQKLLEWLGFEAGDIVYNHPTPGLPQNRPDFVAKMFGSTAFVIEDKSTDEQLDTASFNQLRRYTVGTSGYCLWTNARSIVGLRFDANGDHQTLVEVRIDSVFGNLPSTVDQEANFEILQLLYHKQRFSDLANIIEAIAIDENEWKQRTKSLTDEASLRKFIDESRYVLDQLTTAIRARLSNVTLELAEAATDLASSQKKYLAILSNLFDRLKGGGGVNLTEVSKLERELQDLASRLIDIDTSYTERMKPAMSAATLPLWNSAVQDIKTVVSGLRERELARNESRRIRAAYLVWLERYKYIEGEERGDENAIESRRQQDFAEQVSYVFFARLLLVRVLEDKGIMARIVSDGGFKHWYSFLRASAIEDRVHEIRGESFLPLVYSRVVSYYRHFFQQPVFDWFMPDDYLLALALYRLNMYDFAEAAQSATQVQNKRVIQNYPARTTWNKPWLVNADTAAYDLWEFALSNSKQDLADLLEKKIEVGKGDVRSTWAKPMLNSRQTTHGLPFTKGKNVTDWGSWSTVAYLDPSVAMPTTIKDYTGSRWVQKQILRVANLTHQETVLFLKEVSGLEMQRPIRGTILQRDNKHPVIADETLLVMYTLEPAYEDLAYAAFGLVTSKLYNFFFSLFSTNAHANFKEILRLPVPNWSPELEKRLADETRNVLQIYQSLHQHQEKYGVEQAQHISASRVLQATGLPTLRLEELVLRGDIILNGATSYSLDVLQNRGLLTFNARLDSASIQALERIIRANGKLSYLKEGKDLPVPNLRAATTFLDKLDKIEEERANIHKQVTNSQRALDDRILDAYAITNPAWREIVNIGVPWAK